MSKNIVSCDLKVSETTGSKQSQNSYINLLFDHNIDEFEFESMTTNPQNLSLVQIPKNPDPKSPNPKRKSIDQNSRGELVWDKCSYSFWILQ